jgi:hemolysin D
LLIELESHGTQADVLRLRGELLTARLDSARAQVLLDAIKYQRMPESLEAPVDGASDALLAAAYRWVRGQYSELKTSLDQIDSEIAKLTAEIKTTRAAVSSQQKRVPIARQLVADYLQLLDESAVPKHAYLQKEQERLDQERELELHLGRLNR